MKPGYGKHKALKLKLTKSMATVITLHIPQRPSCMPTSKRRLNKKKPNVILKDLDSNQLQLHH